MRLRPAEVGEHTVTHVFRDVPAPALDHLGAGAMIGVDHVAHVLRIESHCEFGRTNQVAEQNGQLSAFGFGEPRGGCGLGRRPRLLFRCRTRLRGSSQDGGRLQEPEAIAERQPEVFEMLIG
jgi:hypothetical protein